MPQQTAPSAKTAARRERDREVLDAVVVSQTHWDREWYMTFQQYRRRLVHVMDRLLDLLETKPAFRSFTFDGQACVLADYLEIRPENAERIRRLAQAGRLLFGPWFTLPDEWLVSGEAMIRNLLMGHRVAAEWGPVNTVGYCPDAFGHVSQLPQILAGFGLSAVIFMRGMGDELDRLGQTFWWESGDTATRLLAVNQVGRGYGNYSAIGYELGHIDMSIAPMSLERALEDTLKAVEEMRPFLRTRTLLLNNGVDHMEAQANLPEIIAHVNASDRGVRLRHGTYQDFVDAVLAEQPRLETHRGEFHHGRVHVILTGTLSTRIPLKQANARCQALLEGHAEPLAALAQLLAPGEDLRAFLREAWRLVLLNHPHDDICGCSIDQVHREMVPRFEQAEQIGAMIRREALLRAARLSAAPRPGALGHVAVFNPSSWPRTGPAEVTVQLPVALVSETEALRLVAPDGAVVPAEFSWQRRWHTWNFVQFEPVHPNTECHEWRVRLASRTLPPLGLEILAIERGATGGLSGVAATDQTLENEHVVVRVNPNGTLDIECRETGTVFEGLLLFEDVADDGDEYDFSPAEEPGRVTTAACQATSRVREHGPRSATLTVTIPWALPARIEPSRRRRVAETVDATLTLDLTLRAASPVLEVEMAWENRARDHRLRAVFPTRIRTDHSSAETHFDVLDRPLEPPTPRVPWCQNPVNDHPLDRFVSISDGRVGLALLTEGLHEFEAVRTAEGTRLEITVLRCVGWLGQAGLKSRPAGPAGPVIPTPDAQCLGPCTARLAIVPHRGDWFAAQIHRRGAEFNVPLFATQVGGLAGEAPATRSFLEVAPDDLVVTALKQSEHRAAFVARVLNLGPAPVTGRLTAGFGVAEAWLVNLAEHRQEPLPVIDGRAVEVRVRPRQLVTVELTPAK